MHEDIQEKTRRCDKRRIKNIKCVQGFEDRYKGQENSSPCRYTRNIRVFSLEKVVIVCCWIVRDRPGTDKEREDNQKMLDIKNDQNWPLGADLQPAFKGRFYFGRKVDFHLTRELNCGTIKRYAGVAELAACVWAPPVADEAKQARRSARRISRHSRR